MTDLSAQLLQDEWLRVIDVGARGELAGRFATIKQQVEVIGFEPDAAECARLNDGLRGSGWRKAGVLPYAVGRSAADRPFFVAEAPELSSLLEPLTEVVGRPGWRVKRVERVDTVSLDELTTRNELPQPIDFLKLDTQGSELEILRSGEATVLDGVLGVGVEVEFRELYREQPRFSEIEQYLRGRGFELMLLEPAHLRTDWPLARKRTSYADALFLRGPEWFAEKERAGSLRRLLAIYLLHGLYAEAHALARDADSGAAELIRASYDDIRPGALRWRLRLMIDAARCALFPSIVNRHRLARQARAVHTADGRAWPVEPP